MRILVFAIILTFAHSLWMLSWFHVMSLILLMLVAALAPSKIIFLVLNISIKFTVFLRAGNSNIFFSLSLRALSAISVCRLLGKKRSRLMLHRMAFFFDLRIPLHAAMWALFLVAFFSFLHNSNLVVKNMPSVSSVKVLHCSHLILNENTAFLRILATKTIQFAQRSLNIPLPVIPGFILCPVATLHTHLKLYQVPASAPLFPVRASDWESVQAITYPQFSRFLARSLQAIGVDPREFSPHSFGHGGATFAFDCGLPAELIKLQGDWCSDAYLVYLETTDHQKHTAVNAMAHALQQIGL